MFSLKSTFLTLLNEFFITRLLYYKTTCTDGTDPNHDHLHTPTTAKEKRAKDRASEEDDMRQGREMTAGAEGDGWGRRETMPVGRGSRPQVCFYSISCTTLTFV
jgi:hypothetical protein